MPKVQIPRIPGGWIISLPPRIFAFKSLELEAHVFLSLSACDLSFETIIRKHW